MTQDDLTSIASILLSLAMGYFPKLNTRYAKLSKRGKATVMAVLLAVIAVGSFALSCFGVTVAPIACDINGFARIGQLYVLALVANQSAFMLFVDPFKSAEPTPAAPIGLAQREAIR